MIATIGLTPGQPGGESPDPPQTISIVNYTNLSTGSGRGSAANLRAAYDKGNVTDQQIIDSDVVILSEVQNIKFRTAQVDDMAWLETIDPNVQIVPYFRLDLIYVADALGTGQSFADAISGPIPGPSWEFPGVTPTENLTCQQSWQESQPRYDEIIDFMEAGGWDFTPHTGGWYPTGWTQHNFPYELGMRKSPPDDRKITFNAVKADPTNSAWIAGLADYAIKWTDHFQTGGWYMDYIKEQHYFNKSVDDPGENGTGSRLLDRWKDKGWNAATNTPSITAGENEIRFAENFLPVEDYFEGYVQFAEIVGPAMKARGKQFISDIYRTNFTPAAYPDLQTQLPRLRAASTFTIESASNVDFPVFTEPVD